MAMRLTLHSRYRPPPPVPAFEDEAAAEPAPRGPIVLTVQELMRRYTVRFARTEPADCTVHGPIVTCDMSLECPGHVKIG